MTQNPLEAHKTYKWKIWIQNLVRLDDKNDLSLYYSPGVAEPCREIQKDPEKAYDYTRKARTVAVVSDWSAVLWLGNIGGIAWLPVMEWKAALFKKFADVDAVPIVLESQDPKQTIQTIKNIAPTFGGINLEDIKAPECFYIEERLQKELDIPVFHDDQHGTAIVVLAWLINALKLTNKSFNKIKVVISGAGAAWIAIGKLLKIFWTEHIVMFDSKGAIHQWTHKKINKYKAEFVETNKEKYEGNLAWWIQNADVFIGVSQPNILTAEHIQTMNTQPIIFALSNPDPEILPEEAKRWWAYIVATGRSDYPNQVNNVLVFPGIFKGALKPEIKHITDIHKKKAAILLADMIDNPTPENIIPDPFTIGIADTIAKAFS